MSDRLLTADEVADLLAVRTDATQMVEPLKDLTEADIPQRIEPIGSGSVPSLTRSAS
jgi:hypothetical protein